MSEGVVVGAPTDSPLALHLLLQLSELGVLGQSLVRSLIHRSVEAPLVVVAAHCRKGGRTLCWDRANRLLLVRWRLLLVDVGGVWS